MDQSDELKEFRKKIDEIDNKILELLSERIEVVKRVKKYKQKKNLPITDRNREKIIFEKLGEKAQEFDLDTNSFKEIFEAIISHSKKIQKRDSNLKLY